MRTNIFMPLILILILILIPINAFARIDILPKKVVIDSRERSGEFTLLNLFDTKGNFRIEILSYKQDENGVYKKLHSPLDSNFNPDDFVRLSPRQFSLEPGGRQKVRLSVRKPTNLPDGEYRFHVKAMRFADDTELENKQGSVSLLMNMGVAIPVVVRHGNIMNDAKIESPELVKLGKNQNKPELHFNIKREGNSSTIGNLEIFWKDENDKEKKIGMVSNANIFTEINHREFHIPLNEMPAGNGKFIIRYNDDINEGAIFDEIIYQP